MDRRSFLTQLAAAGLAGPALTEALAPDFNAGRRSPVQQGLEFEFERWGIRGSNTAVANGVAIAALEKWLNDPANPDYGKKVTLRGKPGDVYLSNRDLTIRRSMVTIDLNNSVWNSNRRIVATGDSGVNGDRSAVLRDVWVINGAIGAGLDSKTPARGPHFLWCEDSGARNLIKNCRSATSFNASFCERTWFYDCQNHHAHFKGRFVIGFLLHMCNDSGLERCLITGDGRFGFGIQIKGGNRNRVVSCEVRDITNGYEAGAAIYVRGDAPYKRSATSDRTYPFADLYWDKPDPRRESRDTLIIGARVSNAATMNAITVQEQARTVVQDLRASGVRNGIRVIRDPRAPAGHGHGFKLDGAEIEANGRAININGATQGRRPAETDDGDVGKGAGGCMEGVELTNFRAVSRGRGMEGVRMEQTVAARLTNGSGRANSGKGVLVQSSCSPPIIEKVDGIS